VTEFLWDTKVAAVGLRTQQNVSVSGLALVLLDLPNTLFVQLT